MAREKLPANGPVYEVENLVPIIEYGRVTTDAVVESPEASEIYHLMSRLGGLVWEFDPESELFTSISGDPEPMLGLSRERLMTEPGLLFLVAHPDDEHWAREFCRGATREHKDHDFEFRVVHPDGTIRWVRDMVSVFVDEDGRLVRLRGTLWDVTGYRVAQASALEVARESEARYREQLKSLASEIERTADRERRRLAEELHDRVSQTLAIARMRLVAGQSDASDQQAMHAEVLSLIEQAASEVRGLTSELAPVGLYELGLAPALRILCEQVESHNGPTFTVDDQLPPHLAPDEDALAFAFRGVRELVMNAVKHAETDHGYIRLRFDDDAIRITVRDYGVGGYVDPRSWRPGTDGGFGLYSVLERARTLGGDLDVQSVPGSGTIAVLIVPVGAA